ncbi:hypothetical protein WJX72_011333 [[Myrmecia] bisecta]|uniref:NAD(P)H dehydrogenase (quinone) n=1 Tax=[Myrmecia] bisecta TaxID=41462 RepID=A0AAW1QB91_9CHLO
MGFKVAVIYYSLRGRLVTLAHVIAEGACNIPGAEVNLYRVQDPIRGDNEEHYDEGVLDAPVITLQVVREADAIIIGAPGRQGGMCGEMRLFLDGWAQFQLEGRTSGKAGINGGLKGKVGSAFTSVGGLGRGFGGHEAILQSFHATFLQHGMVVIGTPPSMLMEDALMATPFGIVMAGKETATSVPSLSEAEVKLAYGMGEWTAQIAKLLHDTDLNH